MAPISPNPFGVLRKLFRLTVLTNELDTNRVELRELFNWYRDNASGHAIKTRAFFETRDSQYGRVVSETSADPGIPNIRITGIDADHFEISKPKSRDDLIFISVIEFLRQTFVADIAPEPYHIGSEASFGDLPSFLATVKALEDLFYFRWERGSYPLGDETPIIYWPVRLRHPTFIHAAQSFAAAGLQQKGADVRLFIDDLGVQNYPTEDFAEQLSKWFAHVGGDVEKLKITRFSEILPLDESLAEGLADPWPTVRKWLGETAYRFDVILRVSKLFPSSGSLEELNGKRPRRLLTPALVWTCLSHVHATSPQRPLVTLGGYDEKPLWEAWRDRRISTTSNVGHLYAPELLDSDNQHGDGPI